MTPEEMEQAFRTWWAESYRVPANGQAVSSAVAWGIHLQGLLSGDAAPKGRVMDVAKVPEPIQNYWKRLQLEECCAWLIGQGYPDLAAEMHGRTSPKPLVSPGESEE